MRALPIRRRARFSSLVLRAWPRGIRALLPPGSPEAADWQKAAVETNSDADIAKAWRRSARDPAEDSYSAFTSRRIAGPDHDGEQVFLGLIVELQRPTGEIAPAIVVAVE